jgi:hypothetical protein
MFADQPPPPTVAGVMPTSWIKAVIGANRFQPLPTNVPSTYTPPPTESSLPTLAMLGLGGLLLWKYLNK